MEDGVSATLLSSVVVVGCSPFNDFMAHSTSG